MQSSTIESIREVADAVAPPVVQETIPISNKKTNHYVVYIEHCELADKHERNIGLKLCGIVDRLVPGQTIGSQFYNGVWSIWLRSQDARDKIGTIKQIDIDNAKIQLHVSYPINKLIPNEKVLFKDIPFWVPNESLIEFLNLQPGIIVKSGVTYVQFRDDSNNLTPFLSGDRMVYVKGNISKALPDSVLIDYNRCRVIHKSQDISCARCRKVIPPWIQKFVRHIITLTRMRLLSSVLPSMCYAITIPRI